MTIEQLQDRIDKKEQDIAKIEKRIKKWQDSKNEEGCLKRYDFLFNWGKTEEDILSQNYEEYLKDCDNEIRRAERDLEDAKVTLNKYKNLMNLENEKENKFGQRVEVIWNFLLDFKKMCTEWYIRNAKKYFELKQGYADAKQKFYDEHNGKPSYWAEREWKEIYYRPVGALTPSITKLKTDYKDREVIYTGYTVDEEKLEKYLSDDIKARYLKLIDEVTAITGVITDAKNLNIDNGELNGIIIGENGKAKVNTFSAGGWNIQCFHYRTKVTRVG